MEREEGELTDEDLEDVSDNSSALSIPIALTGKSPLREPFRELSLTSISDESDNSLLIERASYRHISRDLYRRHSHKHRREDKFHTSTKRVCRLSDRRNKQQRKSNRKDYSSVSSSSDDSNYKNKTILRQLRDAVRINRSHNLPNCSLRTRIKRMIEPVSNSSDDDNNLEVLRDQALQSKTKSDHNSSPNSMKETVENNVNDEDLAQLRLIALKSAVIKKHAERRKKKEEQLKLDQQNLLQENNENLQHVESEQNLTKPNSDKSKTTSNNNNNEQVEQNKSIEEDEDILRAMLLTSISKKIADKKTVKQKINVLNNAPLPIPNNPNGLTLTVQKTNENNYKLPSMPINRFIINVNTDSETDSDQNETIIPKKPLINPKNDIFDKSLSLFLQQARAKTEEEKSDISHLPRSQQIEYKRLKRKLHILSTRMKQPVNKMKKYSCPDENNKKTKLNYINTKFSKFVAINPTHTMPDKKFQDKTNKDDRLQIKGKYEELTPLMSRVSEARNARDKAQAEVKRLINDLKLARVQLTTNHQEYTVLVQELVRAKADIDKCVDIQNQEMITKKKTPICTSTPNKLKIQEINCELSIVDEDPKLKQQNIEETPAPIEDVVAEIPVVEMMDIVEDKKEATILKYNSPLEHIQLSRKRPLQNPLLELCPYDLLGVCRDSDCLYQHCGNNVTD